MSLFKHQQEAAEFALNAGGRCALFHDPGLGKTRTSLEVYTRLRAQTPGLKLLVVCPLSLVNSAWGNDVRKFTDFYAAPFREAIKFGKLHDVIVINYESLVSAKNLPVIRKMLTQHPFMCVLDESSRLKNNKSLTTKTLLLLAPFFQYRIILSGTPMPNSECELWAQVRFLRSDVFDKSFYAFRNKFFHLERNDRNGQKQIFATQGAFVTRQMMQQIMAQGWKYAITPQRREALLNAIRPFTHWMKKEDALDMPEKIDQVREVELSAKEASAYREMRDELVISLGEQTIAAQIAIAKIMKLRQVTSGFVYDADGAAVPLGNTKLNELEDVLEELGAQQVIVFVEFHHEIAMIQKMIAEKYGADQVVTLYAGTEDREDSIARFQQGKAKYLIAHPKSAAHGLTFVNCSTIVFYSLDYSYESHEQARNRTHRIGQKNSCLYIYLIAKNTIDQVLLDVIRKKEDLQAAVLNIVKGAGNGKRNEHQERRPAVPQSGVPAGVRLQSGRPLDVGHPGHTALP